MLNKYKFNCKHDNQWYSTYNHLGYILHFFLLKFLSKLGIIYKIQNCIGDIL